MVDAHKYQILIVDDHELVRQGMRMLINSEPDMEVCCEAGSIKEVQKVISQMHAEVAVVDLTLPDGSGLDLIKQLHRWQPMMKIVVLSMHDDRLFAERALKLGALAYINKQDSASKLVDGIRQVMHNKYYVSAEVNERLLHRMSNRSDSIGRSPLAILSDRELQVYEFIGQGESTAEIANQLNLSVKTIETYRRNIKKKLNIKSTTELTRSAVVWNLQGDLKSQLVNQQG